MERADFSVQELILTRVLHERIIKSMHAQYYIMYSDRDSAVLTLEQNSAPTFIIHRIRLQ